jgi:nicotinate-nucleotide adenylyltransferase
VIEDAKTKQSVKPMRVGLFGGTFDPVHMGHLRTALEVKEAFALNRCDLIPAAVPPHKRSHAVADARDRLEMIRLAISETSDLEVCDVELNRPGPSFTIDTVNHFRSVLPENTRCFLILGQDAFLEIETWKSYRRLFNLAAMIVMMRPSETITSVKQLRSAMQTMLDNIFAPAYTWSEDAGGFFHQNLQTVYIHPVTMMDISSTKIRDLIKNGKSVNYLMPRNVIEYIVSRGLYR